MMEDDCLLDEENVDLNIDIDLFSTIQWKW